MIDACHEMIRKRSASENEALEAAACVGHYHAFFFFLRHDLLGATQDLTLYISTYHKQNIIQSPSIPDDSTININPSLRHTTLSLASKASKLWSY